LLQFSQRLNFCRWRQRLLAMFSPAGEAQAGGSAVCQFGAQGVSWRRDSRFSVNAGGFFGARPALWHIFGMQQRRTRK